MSNLKKTLLSAIVCLTAVMPFGLIAVEEKFPISKAVIKENTATVDTSNVYWRGGYGWRGRYYGGYGYYSPGYSYSYGYPSYGYGCGSGCCDSCGSYGGYGYGWW